MLYGITCTTSYCIVNTIFIIIFNTKLLQYHDTIQNCIIWSDMIQNDIVYKHIIQYHVESYETILYDFYIILYQKHHILSGYKIIVSYLWYNIVSYHTISCHIMRYRIKSYSIIQYHMILYHVILYDTVPMMQYHKNRNHISCIYIIIHLYQAIWGKKYTVFFDNEIRRFIRSWYCIVFFSPLFTCKLFSPVLNSPRQSCKIKKDSLKHWNLHSLKFLCLQYIFGVF